jgi:non-specific protein-tyrosine kinase
MELKRFLMPVIRWWWLLLAATIIAAVTSFLSVWRQAPIYQTQATLMIGSMIQDPNPNSGEFYLVQQLASAYADMGNREPMKNKTMQALGLTFLPEVIVQPLPASSLIEIRVTDINPQRAQAVANELANQLILSSPTGATAGDETRQKFINEQLDLLQTQIIETNAEITKLQQQLGDLNSARQILDMQSQIRAQHEKLNTLQANYAGLLSTTQRGAVNTLSVIEPAGLPQTPIGPNKAMTVILASAIGLVLATLAAYGMEALDDTYKTSEEISAAFNAPVIGYIPVIKERTNQWTFTSNNPRSPVADAFRILRTNLEFIAVDKPFRSILITGPDLGLGKSVIATNLALILSQAEKNVVLVDADLRKPKLSLALNVEGREGISDICLRKSSFLDAMVLWRNGKNLDKKEITDKLDRTGRGNKEVRQSIDSEADGHVIKLLPSGTIPPNPTDILSSAAFSKLLSEMTDYADVVIIDSPPLFLPDASVLLGKAEGVIMVAELGRTRKGSIKIAKSQIERSGARFLGVVLNRYGVGETYYERSKSYGVPEKKKPGK